MQSLALGLGQCVQGLFISWETFSIPTHFLNATYLYLFDMCDNY
jgi:hypothetical protein